MVLVVAIVAVFGAIAMPRYGASLINYQVDSAARRLRADLILLRETARQQSKSFTVSFTTGTSSQYTMTGIKDFDGSSVANCTVKLYEEPYRATISSLSVGGDAALTFDGFGVPDTAGTIVVQSGSRTRTVNIVAGTGDVTVSAP